MICAHFIDEKAEAQTSEEASIRPQNYCIRCLFLVVAKILRLRQLTEEFVSAYISRG